MKRCYLLLLICSLLGGVPGFAAEAFLPSLLVQEVTTGNASAAAGLVMDINARMREQHGVPLFLRFYRENTLGQAGGHMFLLSPATDFATLLENNRLYSESASFSVQRAQLASVVTPGAALYLKAVRFDGTHTPGWLNNFLVSTNNEHRLLDFLKAFEQGQEQALTTKPLINVFRVVVGQNNFTHLVSFNLPGEEDMGQLLDFMASQGWDTGFPVAPNDDTSLVDNVIYYELTQ